MNIKQVLGYGTDGAVWSTTAKTAIQIFERVRGYYNERDAYLRLADYDYVQEIAGFALPRMLHYDDEIMAVEMDLMHDPPYVIDFAKVRLNSPPDFSEETLRDTEAEGEELFGDN